MDSNAFEKQMRSLEYFHSLRLLPGAWVVIRVDGRGFSRFTESRFEKPFDLEFHRLMVQTAKALLEELHGIYAYTESDEISIVFRPYWTLRKAGENARTATAILDGQSVAFKNELLFQHGINFNELPTWQRRGVGLYWEEYEKQGYNPVQRQAVVASRQRVKVDDELPMKEAYEEFICQLLNAASASE